MLAIKSFEELVSQDQDGGANFDFLKSVNELLDAQNVQGEHLYEKAIEKRKQPIIVGEQELTIRLVKKFRYRHRRFGHPRTSRGRVLVKWFSQFGFQPLGSWVNNGIRAFDMGKKLRGNWWAVVAIEEVKCRRPWYARGGTGGYE